MAQDGWEQVIEYLYVRRLHHFTASLMEAAGPLTLLGAQVVYLSHPVLTFFISPEQAQRLAGLLENPEERKSFIRALRTYKSTS